MMVTIRNATTDANITLLSGEEVVPISWIWERMGEAGGRYNFLAFSLCFTFLLYFIVSFIEMASWILYLLGMQGFMRIYVSTIGYWGSLVGYAVPWILAIVHLNSQLVWNMSMFPASWSLTLFIMGLLLWLVHAALHVLLVPQFLK